MQETIQEMRYVSQQYFRDNLRINAYSLLDLTVGVLNEFSMIEKTLYSPDQGWGNLLNILRLNPLKRISSGRSEYLMSRARYLSFPHGKRI